jgi:hypothetical protein
MDGPVTLWRLPDAEGEIDCTVEQLGEGSFELRISHGQRGLRSETFCDTTALLARAEELREKHTGVVV